MSGGVSEDRSHFYTDLSASVYGANRPGSLALNMIWKRWGRYQSRIGYGDCIPPRPIRLNLLRIVATMDAGIAGN